MERPWLFLEETVHQTSVKEDIKRLEECWRSCLQDWTLGKSGEKKDYWKEKKKKKKHVGENRKMFFYSDETVMNILAWVQSAFLYHFLDASLRH